MLLKLRINYRDEILLVLFHRIQRWTELSALHFLITNEEVLFAKNHSLASQQLVIRVEQKWSVASIRMQFSCTIRSPSALLNGLA